jgi:hypothetical protein
MRFRVICEGEFSNMQGELLAPETLDAILDSIMEEFFALKAVDPDIGATLAKGLVQLAVSVDAPDLKDALHLGGGQIRTAIHAAGGHTPDWEVGTLRVVIEPQAEEGSPTPSLGELVGA